MEGYRLIDERTLAKLRMTAEEADAVAEMWAVQNRLASPASIAPGLVIPPNEVKQYLSQIRAGSARRFRPARSLGADVRLAAVGALVLIGAAIAFNAMYHSRRNEAAYYRGPLTYDTSSSPMAIPARTGYRESQTGNLMRTQYFGYGPPGFSQVPTRLMMRMSQEPVQFIIGRGDSLYRMVGFAPSNQLNALREGLAAVVGGPLSGSTTLPAQPLDRATIEAAMQPPPERFSGRSGTRDLVQWETVQVAFGGKVTQARFPFAKVADRGLREAVRAAQSRLLGDLTEAAKDLQSQISPNTESPTSDVP